MSTPRTPEGGTPVRAHRGTGRRSVMYLFLTLGSLLYGYDLGMMASAILFIQRELHLGAGQVGLIISGVAIGTVVGMVFLGRLCDRYGRRLTLVAGVAVLGLSALGIACSSSASTMVALRVLMGVGMAVTVVVVPTYLAELAPTGRRGAITSLHQFMLACGTLVAFAVGYLLSGQAGWRWIIGLGAVIALVVVVGAAFQPESPRWLMARGREEEARATLRISAPGEVEEVLAQLRADVEATTPARVRLAELVREPRLRRVLLLGCALAVLQQLIGINTIVYYAPKILTAAGFGQSAAILNSVGLGVLSVVATYLELRIVDRVGRRPLLLVGAALMVASMAALGLVFWLSVHPGPVGKVVAVLAVAVFKFAFSLSWGPLVWVTLPEIFPLRLRGAGVSFAALCGQAALFLVTLVFPIMLAAGPAWPFLIFGGFGVLAYVVAAMLLGELSRKSLETIETEVLNTARQETENA